MSTTLNGTENSDCIRMKINGEEYSNLSPNETFALSIQPMIPHLKFMSIDAISFFVNDIISMIREDLKMRVSPMIKHFLIKLVKTPHEEIIQLVYNLLLDLEGLRLNKGV